MNKSMEARLREAEEASYQALLYVVELETRVKKLEDHATALERLTDDGPQHDHHH